MRRRIVFLEIRYPELTDNLRRLYEAYDSFPDRSRYETEIYFLRAGEGGISYVKRCLEMIALVADAKFIYIDESSNVLAALPLRPKTKLIQVWHACGAFKRFGHGLSGHTADGYYGKYDLVSVSAEDIIPVYEQSMRQKTGVVRALGVSRTDVYFEEGYLNARREAVREAHPQTAGRKIVLFAPTFRGNVASARMPELPDIEALGRAFADEYVFLYRGHPAVKERVSVPYTWRDFFLDVTGSPEENRPVLSTEDYLCAADVCVTDYSSLVFDYSLLGRPMLFYACDFEEYDRSRGFYYPYQEFVPGPICRNTADLIREIEEIRDGNWDISRIRRFRKRFMGACDGQATKRIMEAAERL